MTRDDADGLFCVVFGCFLVGGVIGLGLGFWGGHTEACASIQAEWRDNKCVRIVVEDVK